jgi:ribonuclease R
MIKIGDLLEGKISFNTSGSAYLTSGDLPKDIYVHKSKTGTALHLDEVRIKVIEGKGRSLEGKVVNVITRFRDTFVGTLQVTDRYAFLVSDSNKMPVDIFIPLSKLNNGVDGQKATVKIVSWNNDDKCPRGKVVEVLGEAGENDAEIHSILHEYGLPYNFDDDVTAEAESIPTEITEEEIGKRRDMRNVLTFTIDPDTAKDFDDALSYEVLDDGLIRVGIHIADVSHYVRPETDLDKEAYKRGTSVYLVDRVVPMLPEHLSNGVCSLRPHEDKLCFSAIFDINTETGRAEKEWFGRTVIHSDCRLTYEQAQSIIEFPSDGLTAIQGNPANSEVINAVSKMDVIAKLMRSHRFQRGSISFNKHEIKFVLDDDGKPIDVMFKNQMDAHRLIEEFMLLANRRVDRYITRRKLPMVHRIHESPDVEKLSHLKTFIKQFDYKIDIDTPEQVTRSLNKLLLDVQDTPEQNMIENLVQRTMQKAVYSTDGIGHYGLGFSHYTHFTSPIRRYPDVMVHRLLNMYLNDKFNVNVNKLNGKCNHLSERERKAQKAQRDSVKYKKAEYMADKIGKVYTGIVVSVTEYGLFVQMNKNGCDGMISVRDIGKDIFTADLDNYCIVGYNSGEVIRLGDEITVAVKSVDIERKNINLMLIDL